MTNCWSVCARCYSPVNGMSQRGHFILQQGTSGVLVVSYPHRGQVHFFGGLPRCGASLSNGISLMGMMVCIA
ncbi:hypothetical protein [Methanogenium cariaci]